MRGDLDRPLRKGSLNYEFLSKSALSFPKDLGAKSINHANTNASASRSRVAIQTTSSYFKLLAACSPPSHTKGTRRQETKETGVCSRLLRPELAEIPEAGKSAPILLRNFSVEPWLKFLRRTKWADSVELTEFAHRNLFYSSRSSHMTGSARTAEIASFFFCTLATHGRLEDSEDGDKRQHLCCKPKRMTTRT